MALYRSDDADGLRHLGEALSIFKSLSPDKLARLPPGTALWWAARYFTVDKKPASILSSDTINSVEVRSRVSQHGGATRRAVDDAPSPG